MGREPTLSSVMEFQETLDQNSVVPVLAVGDPDEWQRQGHLLPKENLAFVAFEDIDESTLQQFSPTVIFSPVLAKAFDCIELALHLRNLGFKGEYHAIAPDLPNPGLIEREVTQMCPSLNFKIVFAP